AARLPHAVGKSALWHKRQSRSRKGQGPATRRDRSPNRDGREMIGAVSPSRKCGFHGVRTNPLHPWRGLCRETGRHLPLRGSRSIRMVLTLAVIAARFHLRAGGLIAAVAALALALQIGSACAEGPSVANFTLPNGLEIVVIPDHRTPVVTH